jgi:hypothetical protein
MSGYPTDRLRREQAMETAGKENPIHGVTLPRNRAPGAVGQNRPRSIKWAAKQEKFQPLEMYFFLTSTFIENLSALTFSLRGSGDRWVSYRRADAVMLTFMSEGSNRGRLQTLQAPNIVSGSQFGFGPPSPKSAASDGTKPGA